MTYDDIRWSVVRFPEREDDGALVHTYYLVDEDVIVAQILGDDDEVAYQIVKRLNQWELHERERHRRDLDLGLLDEMGG